MVHTSDFRTRSVISDMQNVGVPGAWPIAIDVGYSSVKGFAPNKIFAFPSYAKNLGKNPVFYGEMEPDEILYRDDATGEVWRVGKSAQQMISERDTGDSQAELYGRDRYFSQMFKVLMDAGLALGLLPNGAGVYRGEPVYIQTGLPPAYLDEDRELLTDTIAGRHAFSIKTAATKHYIKMDFSIERQNIAVMSQPNGTLMSVAMDDNARTIPEAKKYFQSNIIIFDAGFGTLDLFDIKNRSIDTTETFSEFGMREVLARCGRKIKDKMNVVIRPSAMQKFLDEGVVMIRKRSREGVSSAKEPFGALLEEASKEVCADAIEKVTNVYSGLFDYDYLILTGGTSAAWEEQIRDYYGDMDHLLVITGNVNCPGLDLIFSNVRGYYMYLINSLRRAAAAAAAASGTAQR